MTAAIKVKEWTKYGAKGGAATDGKKSKLLGRTVKQREHFFSNEASREPSVTDRKEEAKMPLSRSVHLSSSFMAKTKYPAIARDTNAQLRDAVDQARSIKMNQLSVKYEQLGAAIVNSAINLKLSNDIKESERDEDGSRRVVMVQQS